MSGAAVENVADKERIPVIIESNVLVAEPAGTAVPAVSRIRSTRTRVVRVLKRLRRKNPVDVQKRIPRSGLEPFGPIDEEQSEAPSDISGITDIASSDDLSWDDGKSTRKPCGKESSPLKTFKQSSRLHQPSTNTSPTDLPNSMNPSFSQSLGTWLDSLSCLVNSKEMNTFLDSSNTLAISAAHKSLETARSVGEIAVHTALLPVTLPLHVTASATGLAFDKGSDALHYFCDNIVPIVINHAMKLPKDPMLTMGVDLDTSGRFQTGPGSRTTRESNELAATQLQKSQSFHYDDKFLDRLRLDSHLTTRKDFVDIDDSSLAVYSVNTDSLVVPLINSLTDNLTDNLNYSEFILRVDDIYVNFKPKTDSNSQVRVFCVDLDKEFSDDTLIYDALVQLGQRPVDIALSNDFILTASPDQKTEMPGTSNSIRVDWKPLGQTKKDYNRLKVLSKSEYYDEISSRICIWSGKYLGDKYHGSENPFLMAQGVVNGSPIEILNLLWDNERINEYNKHCVKREDVFSIIDETGTTDTTIRGAKIIKSETKIPFTSMSVHLSALMCAKLLGDRPEDGFIIFSRSLNRGPRPTGPQSSNSEGLCQSNNNEVILGANIMRPVPGRLDLTDLISISQVDASILPPFLRSRVGIMAAEDFFKNVRIALQRSKKI